MGDISHQEEMWDRRDREKGDTTAQQQQQQFLLDYIKVPYNIFNRCLVSSRIHLNHYDYTVLSAICISRDSPKDIENVVLQLWCSNSLRKLHN